MKVTKFEETQGCICSNENIPNIFLVGYEVRGYLWPFDEGENWTLKARKLT